MSCSLGLTRGLGRGLSGSQGSGPPALEVSKGYGKGLPSHLACPPSSPGPVPGLWVAAGCGRNAADSKLRHLLVQPSYGWCPALDEGRTDQGHLSFCKLAGLSCLLNPCCLCYTIASRGQGPRLGGPHQVRSPAPFPVHSEVTRAEGKATSYCALSLR